MCGQRAGVSRGYCSGQAVFDGLCQLFGNAVDTGQFADTRRCGRLLRPEAPNESAFAGWAEAWNVIERAFVLRFLSSVAVAGDGEAVRFIAQALDEVKSGISVSESCDASIRVVQQFFAGVAVFAFGHADAGNVQ